MLYIFAFSWFIRLGARYQLSPTWWLSRVSNYAGQGKTRKITNPWYAVKPIPNIEKKRVDFEIVKGWKGIGTTIQTDAGDYDPSPLATVARGVGKCPNCDNIIENDYICLQSQSNNLGHQLYAVARQNGNSDLEFTKPKECDVNAVKIVEVKVAEKLVKWESIGLIPHEPTPINPQYSMIRNYGITEWGQCFNNRQLLTLITHIEIINEAKQIIQSEYTQAKAIAIITYLVFIIDRFIDKNCRLTNYDSPYRKIARATATHALNLMWNYPELNGSKYGWLFCASSIVDNYTKLCSFFGTKPGISRIPDIEQHDFKYVQVDLASADSLFHIPDKSINAIVTDPPYYSTIPYADLSDFFYVWLKRTLGDIFPELFYLELTDKDREAVANPSRFRNMGVSPEELANQDYEAKMAMAFAEYHRVLRDDGVMTVQFNHKDSGAWDVLAKSLIDAGFEITASWAVSTENPQNMHQAQKNAVSSTVLLVCRKREPDAIQAWWDDVRIDVRNIVFEKAPEIEKSLTADSRPVADRVADPRRRLKPPGIDLCLTAFGSALSVFTKYSSVLDSAGNAVEPKAAFEEVRQTIVEYRLQRLLEGKDFNGIDPLTQWYILAWDTFEAREFPFDEARQLALAVGGFDVSDLVKKHKLLDSASGYCKLLTPQQRLKKRAFSVNDSEFSPRYLVDGLHAIIALYQEEGGIEPVRRFMKNTGLVSNDLFMRTFEVALKVIPRIGDEKKRIPEEKALLDLWLATDELKAQVSYVQPELTLNYGQMSLDFDLSDG